MKKINFTSNQFAFIIKNALIYIDKGQNIISVEEVENIIESKKLLPWIEFNICSLDFWDNSQRQIMEENFYLLLRTEDFGIKNNGVLLLIQFCNIFSINLPTKI